MQQPSPVPPQMVPPPTADQSGQYQQQWMTYQQPPPQQPPVPPPAGWTPQPVPPPTQQTQYAIAPDTATDGIRSLWIGDLQQWMDENYLIGIFAHTGEVSKFTLTFIVLEFLLYFFVLSRKVEKRIFEVVKLMREYNWWTID